MNKHVVSTNENINWPRGFTILDNRIHDELQRYLRPSSFCIWCQYLRFWGSDKKKAYPSLSYLSNVTGLAERTIRSCNTELVDKKFLKKKSGSSNSSNIYYYVPIDKILKYYKDGTEPEADKESVSETQDINDLLKDVAKGNQISAALFIKDFEDGHGGQYNLNDKDIEALNQNSTQLSPKLIDIFFKTKNPYIANSDHTMYFFFRPKTQQVLKAEFFKSDIGRWTNQAERAWAGIMPVLSNPQTPELKTTILNDLNTFIKTYVKFNRGNSSRDAFVYKYLEQKIEAFLKDK
jgi:hypothetical protein